MTPERQRYTSTAALLILLCACALASYSRWLALNTFWHDSARWLFEALRTAWGEVPYRDFTWLYPPLGLLLFGRLFRWFGATFTVAQVAIDLLCLLVVLLVWRVARRFLGDILGLAATLAFLATALQNMGFFSLNIYTPAFLTGFIGFLWFFLAILNYAGHGRYSWRTLANTVGGATTAFLSKPEPAVAVVVCFGVLALVDRRLYYRALPAKVWFRSYLVWGGALLLPSLLLYGAVARWAGWPNLIAGITGYGLAKGSCPWWPTGIGLFGGVASIGWGMTMTAVCSLPVCRSLAARHPDRYGRFLIAAALGALFFVLYLPLVVADTNRGLPPSPLIYIASATALLLPVLWLSWVLLVRRLVGMRRPLWSGEGGFTPRQLSTLLLLTACATLSVRALFGSLTSYLPAVSDFCPPFLFVLGALLLATFLNRFDLKGDWPVPSIRSAGALIALAVLIGYAGLRTVGTAFQQRVHTAIPTRIATIQPQKGGPQPLETASGTVWLADPIAAAAYRYVMEHSAPSDTVLDLNYGQGINFASRRRSPIFFTQFIALSPTDREMQRDLARIRKTPPALVVANALPGFGAVYGIPSTACSCPALVWRPRLAANDTRKTFPVLEYVRENYRVEGRLPRSNITFLRPGPPLPAAPAR